MILFDKGRLLTKEICELCKKEIKPGEKMIILTLCPSHERQLSNRLWSPGVYDYIDTAPKYHEKCYIKKEKSF
jgi:DNA polymerase IIIc chi subunit